MLLERQGIFFIHDQATAVGRFGLPAGPVGGGNGVFEGHASVDLDQPDRAAHIKSLAAHPVGPGAYAVHNALAHVGGHGNWGIPKHNHKLIAADPPKLDVARQHVGDAFANLLQDLIAHAMAKQVVDQLEPVQVQVSQPHGPLARQLLDGAIEHPLDATAVQHFGQGVMVGQKVQVFCGL